MNTKRTTTTAIAAVALAAAGALSATTGHAAKGTLRACVANRTGAVRIVDTCHRGEHALAWNRRGPVGPQGERGPAGGIAIGTTTGGASPMSFSPGGNGSSWADGPGAFAHVTTATQVAGFGTNVFSAVTTGANNTGVGYGAGRLTNGSGNTALGTAAMYDSTAGDLNVAVGLHAGRQVNGTMNVFVGADAQNGPASPSASIAVGYGTTVSANNAVALGATARAEHAGSVALGQGSVTTAAQQVMAGPRDIEITDASKGIVLKSPNGTRFRLTVADDGTLTTTAL